MGRRCQNRNKGDDKACQGHVKADCGHGWENLAVDVKGSRYDVDQFGSKEDHPAVDDQVRIVELDHTHDPGSDRESDRYGSEYGPEPTKMAGQIGEKPPDAWRPQLRGPVVLTTRVWVGRAQLRQSDADGNGGEEEDDEPIHDTDGSSTGEADHLGYGQQT